MKYEAKLKDISTKVDFLERIVAKHFIPSSVIHVLLIKVKKNNYYINNSIFK